MKSDKSKKIRLVEPALDICMVTLRTKIEVRQKIVQKFGTPDEPPSKTIRRVLEDLAKNIKLTAENKAAVTEEIAENYRKRMEARRKAESADDNRRTRASVKDYSGFAEK